MTLPENPTDGAMRSELERLGVKVRGLPFTSKQLAAMLRERGYTIRDGAKPSQETDDR